MAAMLWKVFSRESKESDDPQDFAAECYKRGVIAVGWDELRNIRSLESERQLRDMMQRRYKRGTQSAAQWAASLWSFYHEIEVGHYVLCPDRKAHRVYIG